MVKMVLAYHQLNVRSEVVYPAEFVQMVMASVVSVRNTDYNKVTFLIIYFQKSILPLSFSHGLMRTNDQR